MNMRRTMGDPQDRERDSGADPVLVRRLAQFLDAMLPIAIAFLVAYLGIALYLRSTAFAGGAVAVGSYVVALLVARGAAKKGAFGRAALIIGYALLFMVSIGTWFLHFLMPALLLMPLAGVAVVLPYARGRTLLVYFCVAFAVDILLVVGGVLPPLFEQPPKWLQASVLVGAVAACVFLTLRLLWVDAMRLRDAVDLRDEFLAVASHELRTPLTPLSLRLERMKRQLGKGALDAAVASEDVLAMQRQVRRLSDLVSALLDVTRIRHGGIQLTLEEGVDLCAVTREVVTRFEPEAKRAGVDLRVDTPDSSLGRWDQLRIEQVLTNLLSNAFKYGAGKPVHVQVEGDAESASVLVRDEGIGMDENQIPQLFKRFVRGVSDRHYGGLGLGLYISRQLVEALGGEIHVEAAEQQGATFRVVLPRKGPPA